jgi:hypothetical protein
MQDKHQWMSHTLFDMAAFCDRNGMDRQRDVLLDAVAALSGSWSGNLSAASLGIEDQIPCKEGLREQLARAHAA